MCDLVKDHSSHRATAHATTVGCGDFNDEIVGELNRVGSLPAHHLGKHRLRQIAKHIVEHDAGLIAVDRKHLHNTALASDQRFAPAAFDPKRTSASGRGSYLKFSSQIEIIESHLCNTCPNYS